MNNNEKNPINESIDRETNQQKTAKDLLKSLFTLTLLTAFSYFALILIDNRHSHILESLVLPWKVGEYQEIALKSLALIFNISFVLGLSGMILSLLSKSGISFVDKLIEKIIDNAMGSGGGAGGASSFFSIPTLLSASVATTIGVAAVNAYQISPTPSNQVPNSNTDSNIAEINDKLQQVISLSKSYQSSIEALNLTAEKTLNQINYLSASIPNPPGEYYDLSKKIEVNEKAINAIRSELNETFRSVCKEYNPDDDGKVCNNFFE